jgi:hypothetical protein
MGNSDDILNIDYIDNNDYIASSDYIDYSKAVLSIRSVVIVDHFFSYH